MKKRRVRQETATDIAPTTTTKATLLHQTFVKRIRAGNVLPILSNVVNCELVLGAGQYANLVKTYAQKVKYKPDIPSGELRLAQIIQHASVIREEVPDPIAAKEIYADLVKNRLFELAKTDGLTPGIADELKDQFDTLTFTALAEKLDYPKTNRGTDDPLLVLADFSLPIYITTCHHAFIELALKRNGKVPFTAICPWGDGFEVRPFNVFEDGEARFPRNYRPSRDQPLVYHMHGFDEYPASLVLTEDDYLEFLVAILRDKGNNNIDPIPPYIKEALVQSSLILLGFHLRSWDFRTLFFGLIKPGIKARQYRSVSVQLAPEEIDNKYLQSYLSEAKFDVYPGTIHQYVQELRRVWEGS